MRECVCEREEMFICRKKEGCYGGMYTIPGSLDREGTMIEKRRFKEQSFRNRDILVLP